MFVARAISRVGRATSSARISRSFLSSSVSFKPQVPRFCSRAVLVQHPRLIAHFSTTRHAFGKYGTVGGPNTVDEELAAKIQSELEVEKMKEYDDDMPLSLREFLENSLFEVNDKPGEEEVQLVRNFGDEIIRVEFSIADLNAASGADDIDDSTLFDDQATDDDIASGQSGDAQSKAAKSEGRISVANDGAEEEEFDEDQPVSFPSRVNVTIEKKNGGALQFEAVAQDGMIVIDNVFYHRSAELATAKTVSADWERRGLYAGPPFSNLDEDLQVLLERYLDERGINTALALFIPDYIDYKEQKEYVSWLSSVKSFVEA